MRQLAMGMTSPHFWHFGEKQNTKMPDFPEKSFSTGSFEAKLLDRNSPVWPLFLKVGVLQRETDAVAEK